MNNVALQAADYCSIQGSNELNGDTIVIVGGSGSVTIGGYLNMTNSQCSSAAALSTTLESVLSSIASQESISAGFAFPSSNSISISNMILNQISESVSQSCVITGSNTENNDYIFVKDRSGDISIGSRTEISGSTCTLSAALTAVSNSKGSSQTSQKSISIGPIATMLLGGVLIVGGIAAVVVLMMFSGKVKVPSLPSAAQSSPANPLLQGKSGRLAEAEGAVEANPELLLA